MFGIGGPELVVILIVALLLVGPDKLPQVAKTVGTGLRDLRRAANLAQNELRETMDELTREVDRVAKDVDPRDPPTAGKDPAANVDALSKDRSPHAEAALWPVAKDDFAESSRPFAQAAPAVLPSAAAVAAPAFTAGPPPDGAVFAVVQRRRPEGNPASEDPVQAAALSEQSARRADEQPAPATAEAAPSGRVVVAAAGGQARSRAPRAVRDAGDTVETTTDAADSSPAADAMAHPAPQAEATAPTAEGDTAGV